MDLMKEPAARCGDLHRYFITLWSGGGTQSHWRLAVARLGTRLRPLLSFESVDLSVFIRPFRC